MFFFIEKGGILLAFLLLAEVFFLFSGEGKKRPELMPIEKKDTMHYEVLAGFTKSICPTPAYSGETENISNICGNISSGGRFIPSDRNSCMEFSAPAIGEYAACIQMCNKQGICDTIFVVVNVVPPKKDTIEIVLQAGKDSLFCLSKNELAGSILPEIDECGRKSVGLAEVAIDHESLCLSFLGIKEGLDVRCYTICDQNGICDTSFFNIKIFSPNGLRPSSLVDYSTSTFKNQSVTIPLLEKEPLVDILELKILMEPGRGVATVNIDEYQVTYYPNWDFCGEKDTFSYVITNRFGSSSGQISVNVLCEPIVVFSGFSPNGDGINDYFNILGIDKFPDNEVCVFNYQGYQVYSEKGYSSTAPWDGTVDGKPLPPDTYYYLVDDGKGTRYSGYLRIHY